MSTNQEDTCMPWSREGEDAFAALDELQQGISPQSSIPLIPAQDNHDNTNLGLSDAVPASASGSFGLQEDDALDGLEGPSISLIRSPGLPAIPDIPSRSSFYTDTDLQTLTRQNSRVLNELNRRTPSIQTEVLTHALNLPYERAASYPPDRVNPFASSPSPERQAVPKPPTSAIEGAPYNAQAAQSRARSLGYGNPREVVPEYQTSEHSRSPSVEYVQEQQSRSPSVEYVDDAFVKEEEDDLPSPGSSPSHDYESRFLSLSPVRLPPSNRYPVQSTFSHPNDAFVNDFPPSPPRRAFARRSPSLSNDNESEDDGPWPDVSNHQVPAEGSLSPLIQTGSPEHKANKTKNGKRAASKTSKSSRKNTAASRSSSKSSAAAHLPKRVYPGYERGTPRNASSRRNSTASRAEDLSNLTRELSIVKEENYENSDNESAYGKEGPAKKRRHASAAKSKDTKPRKRSARPPREDSVFDDEYREAQQERIRYFQEVDKFKLETETMKVQQQSSRTRVMASFVLLI